MDWVDLIRLPLRIVYLLHSVVCKLQRVVDYVIFVAENNLPFGKDSERHRTSELIMRVLGS